MPPAEGPADRFGAARASLRRREGGPLLLIDDAVSTFAADPLRWWRLVLPTLLPTVVAATAFLYLHAYALVDGEFSDRATFLPSLLSSIVLAVMLVLRHLSHVEVARELWRDRTLPTAPAAGRVSTTILLAALGIGATVLLTVPLWFFALPILAFFAPVTGLAGAESIGGAGVLQRLSRGAPGTLSRSVLVTGVFFSGVLVAWLNLVIAVALAPRLAETLAGLRVGLLARALDLSRVEVAASLALVIFVVAEPIWAILRALLYLDARERASGADLRERWSRLRGLALVVAVWLLPVPIFAGEPEPPEAAPVVEGPRPTRTVQQWADDVELAVAPVRLALKDGNTEVIDITPEIEGLRAALSGPVWRDDGEAWTLDGSALLQPAPALLTDHDTRARLDRVLTRIEGAVAWTRNTPPAPSRALDPAAMVRSLPALARAEESAGDRFRAGIGERIRAWLRELFRVDPQERQRREQVGKGLGPVMIALLVVLGPVVLALIRGKGVVRSTEPQPSLGAPVRIDAGFGAAAPRLLLDGGDYRASIRASYLLALRHLRQRRLVEARPDWTWRDHERVLGSPVRAGFGDLGRGYERATFSLDEVGRAEAEEALVQAESLAAVPPEDPR